MKSPRIQHVTNDELRWIDSQRESARQFVAFYSPNHKNDQLSLEALDSAWNAWMATSPARADEINAVINYIGITFCSLLVQSGRFTWCIATDEFGTDLAIHALQGLEEVLIYPADFVSKRWDSSTSDFMADAYIDIIEQVSNSR